MWENGWKIRVKALLLGRLIEEHIALFLERCSGTFHMVILIIYEKYTEQKKKKVEKKEDISNSSSSKQCLKVEHKTNHT